MADTLPLDYVQSSPTGPSGGRLGIEPSRVTVVRKGVFGTRAAMARPRQELRGSEAGTASDLAARSWMTAGAQLALQRAATENPEAPFLAIRFEDAMGTGDVWLFRGPTEQMDLAIGALSSGGVVSGPTVGSAGAAGANASAEAMRDDRAVERNIETVGRVLHAGYRARRASAGVVTLVVLGVGAYVGLKVVPDVIEDVRTTFSIPQIPGLPTDIQIPTVVTPPPQQDEARPFSVDQARRGLGNQSVADAGVTRAGRERRSGRSVIFPLRHRGRALRLIVFPDPGQARGARGPRDALLANLVLRGSTQATVAPVIFVAVANPSEPTI